MTLLTGIILGVAVWLLVAILLGLLIARSIRLREERDPRVPSQRRSATDTGLGGGPLRQHQPEDVRSPWRTRR